MFRASSSSYVEMGASSVLANGWCAGVWAVSATWSESHSSETFYGEEPEIESVRYYGLWKVSEKCSWVFHRGVAGCASGYSFLI